ncbi:MAG TPA: PLP-dependent aminotransferase family protein [Thermoanaerobaculia bacterium]|jgi:GntR family transcriptional regulator/MocR family aminotransferase|nr:PLP-dependent aminotransferase family protein [Thermoanaerobaculia bacterium]
MKTYSSALPNAGILLDESSGVPLHAQLYEQLRGAMLSGRLAPGTRLPSTREMARELGVARNTVLNAFDQLGAEGYLEGRVGDGTYVSAQVPDDLFHVDREDRPRGRPGEGAPLSARGRKIEAASVSPANYCGQPRPFRTSTPALDVFPYQLWSRLLTRRWRRSGRELLTYGDPAGYRPLREAIARYLGAARGVRCHSDSIVLTNGSMHALEMIARVLLDAGDPAWIEDPGFLGARAALTTAGARLIPVPVDCEGMDVDAGIEQCHHARFAYVTPSHQYPLGPTLSLRRRLALLQWARRTGAWILEDDYDSEYRYTGKPLPSLQGMDTDERVIYIGTFSKVLFPAIRVGYIVSPPGLYPALVAARSLGGHATAPLDHAALADFISSGHFARHLRRMRVIYAARQRSLLNAAQSELKGLLDVEPGEAGMHLMGWLPESLDDHAAAIAAASHGVEVTPLSAYCLRPPQRGALRLGYTGYAPKQLWEGARRLASALRGQGFKRVDRTQANPFPSD